jgi:hypothetical protein
MRPTSYLSILLAFALAATFGCQQSYMPPVIANPPTYLVVEGFINNGADSTYFTLSHTYKLSDSTSTTPELNATVTVEGTDNSSFPLGEVGNGQYGAQLPALNAATKYRLHIITTASKQYASNYVTLLNNPPFDSINFIRNNDGVTIYANTHDPTNAAQYFRYEYQETWEYHSAYYATLLFVNGSLQTYSPNTIFTCWHGDISSNIILANSTQLGQAVIYEKPLVHIPFAAVQLSVEYSLLVKQYALTQDAFNWWSIMQNNTENIGSIFGVQPSTNQGNLHCLTDTSEQVIGFVSAGNIRSQRIFITNAQVSPWIFEPECTEIQVAPDPTTVARYYGEGYRPIDLTNNQEFLNMSFENCVDCTLTGTNIQPSFWQ